ncbi:hypothetical protein SAMN02910368_01449 [Lachnospiraceae bacterium G11]|nr:hypothetical protein SAMN02910368_01449 [Lachnospiraceae bacterium G11]
MFGYIIINKGELKFKEFDVYQGYYCGLCRVLKEKYGIKGQMTLSYDMTFLAMLLSDLYEPELTRGTTKCIVHPFEKHPTIRTEFTEYAADMNILLTYYKCLDDWNDDRKADRKLLADMLCGPVCKIRNKYPEKADLIRRTLDEMSEKEKQKVRDVDEMSALFGEILGTIFSYRDDEWADELYTIGNNLGRFIYIMDAYEDIEDDIKKNRYNPFIDDYRNPEFDEDIQKVLTKMMSECCKAFELLPIINDIDILRNILYSGVWSRYELVRNKRNKEEENHA